MTFESSIISHHHHTCGNLHTLRRRVILLDSVFVIVIVAVLLCGGCRRSPLPDRLTAINALSETEPLAVLDSLRAINPDTLSERDRNYYDFLTVKCERKAYLPIESDSLILKVIDYASRHKADGYYPEALYTAGLVYVASGDQPTALEYFHNSLNELGNDEQNLLLREKLNSQIGKFFSNLRFDEEALPYINTAIEIARMRKDTLALVSEYQLLALNYRRSDKLMEADSVISLSLFISGKIDSRIRAVSVMQHAMLQHTLGISDSARYYIRQAVNMVPVHTRNTALAYAAQIYQKAGMTDSACYFAFQLINSDQEEGKVCGYQILLSPEARRYIPSGIELDNLYTIYTTYLSRYMDENSLQMIREQEASYNYSLHQKKRLEAEQQSYRKGMWIAILIACCTVLILIITVVRSRSRRKILQLRNAVTELQRLLAYNGIERTITLSRPLASVGNESRDVDNSEAMASGPQTSVHLSEKDRLRKELQEHLMELLQRNPNPDINPVILNSTEYEEFHNAAKEGRAIGENSEEWERLERMIDRVSPDFVERLRTLSTKKLKRHEVHLALLIKCGFRTSDAANLISLSKQTISYHRRKISTLFSDDGISNGMMEVLIRLL